MEVTESWRPIKGFEDYLVSDMGRVLSRKWGKERILKAVPSIPCGYPVVNLYVGRRLITFLRAPRRGEECRHLDGDSGNNQLANLTWGSSLQNQADMIQHGKRASQRGESNNYHKLTRAKVIYIRRHIDFIRTSSLARRYGVTPETIRRAATGKQWAHIKVGLSP